MINYCGELIAYENAHLPFDHRAVAYADSLFETIRFSHQSLRFFEDHYFRLMSGMRIYRMEIPMHFSPEYLEGEVFKLLKAKSLFDGQARIRLQVFRSGTGFYVPSNTEIGFLISAAELENPSFEIGKGLEMDLYKDMAKPIHLLSGLKQSGAGLYIIAGIWARENGLDDCFLLNERKNLCESVSGNVFLVKGDELHTPSLSSGCLKGVMRKQILRLASKMGLKTFEGEISPFELLKADEVWLSNAISGVQWMKTYRQNHYSNERAQEMCNLLNTERAAPN